MENGLRIYITDGKRRKSFVLVEPPYVKAGDSVMFEGTEWIVTSRRKTSFWRIPMKAEEVFRRTTPEPSPPANKFNSRDCLSRN